MGAQKSERGKKGQTVCIVAELPAAQMFALARKIAVNNVIVSTNDFYEIFSRYRINSSSLNTLSINRSNRRTSHVQQSYLLLASNRSVDRRLDTRKRGSRKRHYLGGTGPNRELSSDFVLA